MFSSNKLKHEFLNINTLLVKFLYAINIQKQKFHHIITLKIMAVPKILRRGKRHLEVALVGALRAEPRGHRGLYENFQKIS